MEYILELVGVGRRDTIISRNVLMHDTTGLRYRDVTNKMCLYCNRPHLYLNNHLLVGQDYYELLLYEKNSVEINLNLFAIITRDDVLNGRCIEIGTAQNYRGLVFGDMQRAFLGSQGNSIERNIPRAEDFRAVPYRRMGTEDPLVAPNQALEQLVRGVNQGEFGAMLRSVLSQEVTSDIAVRQTPIQRSTVSTITKLDVKTLIKYIDETERIYIIDCNLSNNKDYFKGQVKMLTDRKVLKMEVTKIKRSKYAIAIFVKKV